MTTSFRILAAASLIGIVSLACGCSSDKKANSSSKTYQLSIPATDQAWKRPKGGSAKEFGAYVPPFLFTINGSDVLFATALANGDQDPCTPTTHITASAPETQIGPVDVKLHVSNGVGGAKVMPAYNLTLTSIVSNTPAGTIPPGKFEATMDARDLYPLIYKQKETAESLCRVLGTSYESPCTACPSSAGNTDTYCVDLMAAGLATTPSDVTLHSISESDVSPTCESETPADAG